MKNAPTLKIPFKWENRHPAFLKSQLLYIPSYYAEHGKWEARSWSHPDFFGNDQPVVIEYCSGNGQWIVERAKTNPEINWVAVEKKFERARKIWTKVQKHQIPNLFVICGDARDFSRYYVPKNSIDKVFVNFPDPWPKFRHAKHRLIQEDFLKEIEQIAKIGANAFFTTDDFPYMEQMREEISARKWKSLIPDPFFAEDLPDYGKSYFYDLWKSKGRKIYHLQFEVNP